MQKLQKTYAPDFTREAVRLAQISGKPIAQAEPILLSVHPAVVAFIRMCLTSPSAVIRGRRRKW